MSNWREPITDRTLQDVKNYDAGSLDYQKGALNADDLNRIENNYKYLMAKLRSDAIFIPHRLRNYAETVIKTVETEVSASKMPDGYTQVEYVESTGTQYIDTGFKPNQDTRVVMDFKVTDGVTGEHQLCSARDASTGPYFIIVMATTNSLWYRVRMGTQALQNFSNNNYERKQIDFNKNLVTMDGETKTFTYSAYQLSANLTIFARNTGGTIDAYTSMKLYSMQIYDNDKLVRNFIPCKNASGSVGLYDLVNTKFYANAGTGTFTSGAEIEAETETVITYEEITTTYTDWQEHNLPWLSEINRIRANYNALVRLFLVGLGFSEQKESNYLDYIEVNNWEKIALAGKTIFENMEKEYRFCGVEVSGGDRLL